MGILTFGYHRWVDLFGRCSEWQARRRENDGENGREEGCKERLIEING